MTFSPLRRAAPSAGARARSSIRQGLVPSLLAAGSAVAQSAAEPRPPTLDPVVVTATRTPTRVDQTIAEVTLIDREQIERATGRTLPELLAQQAGVQFSSNGGLGKSSSVNLRGLESRHTLLLIDGVRYGSATLGTPSFDNLPLDAIERIEIVRGPLSGLYGSDAVGGVINVFTRKSRPGWRPNASLTAGSDRFFKASAGVGFAEGEIDGAVQLQRTTTRGFSATNPRVPFNNHNPDDDGFRQTGASVQLGTRLGSGWRVDARLLQSDGISRFDDGLGADARAGLRSQLLAIEAGGPVAGIWRSSLRLSRAADGFDTLTSASATPSLGSIETVQRQLTWENTFATRLGSAVVVAERIEQAVSRPGAAFSVSNRNINALGLGLNGRLDRHTWQANLRHDRNSQFGSQSNGSLGYGYDLTPVWRLAGSLGTSFVAPSFNQLYFPGFGNSNLQPEEGRHGEVSLRWARDGQQVRLTRFDNRIRGYIASGPAPTNIPKTRVDGFSLAYDAVLADWTLGASADHVDPRNETAGSPNAGKLLPRRARDSLKLAADRDAGAWRYGGSFNAFSDRFDNAANTLGVGGYGTLDLRADWRFARDWSLGLRLNNVGDKRYETVYGYNQPGREAFVTVRYGGL